MITPVYNFNTLDATTTDFNADGEPIGYHHTATNLGPIDVILSVLIVLTLILLYFFPKNGH